MKYNLVVLIMMTLIVSSCKKQKEALSPISSNPKNLTMILVEGGTFVRSGILTRNSNDFVTHSVTLSDFFISKYEITQYQWIKNMGFRSHLSTGANRPVGGEKWASTLAFCNQLSINEGFNPCYTINDTAIVCNWEADGYRLPTEAEWEYAARGGNLSFGYMYSGDDDPNEVSWNKNNSNGRTEDVGLKNPNELGIYDMSGNAIEWCWDFFEENYYVNCFEQGTVINPKGPESSGRNVVRGGHHSTSESELTTAVRGWRFTTSTEHATGFRVVRRIN